MAEEKTTSPQNASDRAPVLESSLNGASILVKGKYRVYPSTPLPLLDMPNAKAYQAEEIGSDHKIFAYVCQPSLPIRKDHIKSRTSVKIEGVLPFVDAGVAFWPAFSQKTTFLLYETPLGGRVIHSKKYSKILPEEESEKISKWIRPLLMGINNLAVRGLTHRAIRPDNLFFKDVEKTKVVWGDCITTPPAYDQPAVFETIESSMCSKGGHGDGNVFDDLYSFGVTLLCLGLGHNPVEGMSDNELLEMKIKKGSYATLVGEERIALGLIELLRGLLADNQDQRWDVSSTQLWVDGRRLTPVQARFSQVSQRPFLFNNVEYFSYRSLAVALWQHWDIASEAIRSEKLHTWIMRGFDDKTTANAIVKSIDMALVKFSTKEKQDDFIIARTCMLLDPKAPLRTRDFSFMPNAFGSMLACSLGDEKIIKQLIGIMMTGYLESCYEIRNDRVAEQSIKMYQIILQKSELGMGFERLLYDMNDGFPCQSPLIVKEHVDELSSFLPAMEEFAKKVTTKIDPIDRHIAAFIASHCGIKLSDQLSAINSPKEGVSIQGRLHLFATLQKTFGPEKLYALCSWLGMLVPPIIAGYHNFEKRQMLERGLPKLIRKGSILEIYRFLDNKEERLYDINYFEQAKREYIKLAEEIEFLDGNREKREEEGILLGDQIASIISFGIAVLTMFFLLLSQFLRG